MQNLTTTQKLLILALAWFVLSGGSIGGVAPPFKTDTLSVLVVEETDEATLKSEAAIDAVKDAVTQAKGRYRRLDKDQTDLSKDDLWVQDAWKAKGETVPWVVGATPRSGVSKALPVDSREAAVGTLAPLGVK